MRSIEAVPNRNSPPAILLRESYREKGRVKKRTLCNLTSWPSHLIEGLRALLKGGSVLPRGSEALTIRRSLPHGHVAAVLGTVRTIGLDRLPGPKGNRCRDLVLAMVVARLLAPASKLATARALDPAPAQSRRRAGLGRGRRGRTLHHARLARRTPAGDRGGAGEAASRGRARWCSTTSRR